MVATPTLLPGHDAPGLSTLLVAHPAEGPGLVPQVAHDPRFLDAPARLSSLAREAGLYRERFERETPDLWKHRRLLAALWALLCHGSFALAVSAMALGLASGMRFGLGRLHGPAAWLANGLLCAQFPLAHSYMLARRGRRWLARTAPGPVGVTLAPTVFATLAALQILSTFVLWSPSGAVLFEPVGALRVASLVVFGLAWLFLLKALSDAGLGLQTGAIGWQALWRGVAPRYPDMPEGGLFAACRQPIYLGFALVLWTGPVWTLDHLVLALAWSGYCYAGPRLKERRFAERYGARFAAYRARTSYFIPALGARVRAARSPCGASRRT